MRFLLPLLVLSAPVSAVSDELTLTPIGHAAVRVTDGKIAALVDFPYDPGADFTPWKPELVPEARKALCIITHAHRDHFAPDLADRYCTAVIGPRDAVGAVHLTSFAVEPGSVVEWKGLRVEAIATPHDSIEHYSYLVVCRGVRLFFSGDAESPDAAFAVGKVDAAFLTPSLLLAVHRSGRTLEAARVISYHHRPGDPVPDVLGRVASRPGEAIKIEIEGR